MTDKNKILEELWAEATDYIPQSIEDVEKELKAKFRKKDNCLYLEEKDLDKLLSTDKKHYKIYFDKNFDEGFLDRYYTATVAGEFLIFERFKTYKGVKIYELGNDSGFFLLENKKGVKYFFYVYQTKSVKSVGNTLIFVYYDGDLTVYDIDKDEFVK